MEAKNEILAGQVLEEAPQTSGENPFDKLDLDNLMECMEAQVEHQSSGGIPTENTSQVLEKDALVALMKDSMDEEPKNIPGFSGQPRMDRKELPVQHQPCLDIVPDRRFDVSVPFTDHSSRPQENEQSRSNFFNQQSLYQQPGDNFHREGMNPYNANGDFRRDAQFQQPSNGSFGGGSRDGEAVFWTGGGFHSHQPNYFRPEMVQDHADGDGLRRFRAAVGMYLLRADRMVLDKLGIRPEMGIVATPEVRRQLKIPDDVKRNELQQFLEDHLPGFVGLNYYGYRKPRPKDCKVKYCNARMDNMVNAKRALKTPLMYGTSPLTIAIY